MRFCLLMTAIAVFASPSFATMPAHQFKADGRTYSYVATRDARGIVHLRGCADMDAFDLEVRGRNVDGTIGRSSVAFKVSEETLAELNDELRPDDGTGGRANGDSLSRTAVN